MLRPLVRSIRERVSLMRHDRAQVRRVNLCCGGQKIPGFIGVDFGGDVDLKRDLRTGPLPFDTGSLDAVTCMSAINYFSRDRAIELVGEVQRVLKTGGVARFGVQDLYAIAQRYVNNDREFFFQRLADGRERFEGPTIGDKFAAWFYGYQINGIPCRYFYDYDSLAYLFTAAGFTHVERMSYRVSRLEHIELIDNRPDQMFFLEAVK